MNIQWYPGHMTKARRDMQESLKLIDIVIELVDARLPLSSRNPDIDELAANKSRIILFTKCDMADEAVNRAWEQYFTAKGFLVKRVDSRKRSDVMKIEPLIAEACKEKIERDKRKGIKNRPIRAMVAGIPNVGKSTFINSFAGKKGAKTGNKPGVTRGNQWIKSGKGLEMLDTPGLLWPKFDDQEVGIKLAVSGSINDDILNTSELSLWLIDYLRENYPEALTERYEIEDISIDASAVLNEIALNRKCLAKGGEADLEKASRILMDDFRSTRLGRISLERPDEDGKDI